MLPHHRFPSRSQTFRDEEVVLLHSDSGFAAVAAAISRECPDSRSLLEQAEGSESSVGVPGPEELDRLRKGVFSDPGPEGVQVRDRGAEVGTSDDPTGPAGDVAHHVPRVGDCRDVFRVDEAGGAAADRR